MLIGLTGYAQHGKDTVAAALVEDFGYTRVAFADPLKQLAYEVNPWVLGEEEGEQVRLAWLVDELGWEGAKANPEVRRVLQVLGTAARTIIGPNVWVDAADLKVQQAPGPVVISDVRFPNEAEYIHRYSGQLWRIQRVNEDGTAFDNGVGTDHPSEAHVAELSIQKLIVAWNVEQLQDTVRSIMGVPAWASND